MRVVRRAILAILFLAILLALAFILFALVRNRPQDLPWTALDLRAPVGAFTGRKLAGMTQDYARCRALLRAADVPYAVLPPVRAENPECGYADGVRLEPAPTRTIRFSPENLGTSCAVAAGLAMWEWNIVQPAAATHLGSKVVGIDHLGSYSCRRIYGRGAGDWSEHAGADAIDIAAFRLADGRRISVLKDWQAGGEKAAFLREVRDGACRLFSTVLSPDYNDAHRDHLHLDQAERGRMGWRACR
jgi:hypothetical protein